MIWHEKTRFYWDFTAVRDKHGMGLQLFDLTDFDEVTFRELCEDLIKYVNQTLATSDKR